MPPNVLLEVLCRHRPEKFREFLGDGLESFWNRVRPDDPRLANNPMVGKADWRRRAIPLVLHGNAMQFTMKQNSLLCIVFS